MASYGIKQRYFSASPNGKKHSAALVAAGPGIHCPTYAVDIAGNAEGALQDLPNHGEFRTSSCKRICQVNIENGDSMVDVPIKNGDSMVI